MKHVEVNKMENCPSYISILPVYFSSFAFLMSCAFGLKMFPCKKSSV